MGKLSIDSIKRRPARLPGTEIDWVIVVMYGTRRVGGASDIMLWWLLLLLKRHFNSAWMAPTKGSIDWAQSLGRKKFSWWCNPKDGWVDIIVHEIGHKSDQQLSLAMLAMSSVCNYCIPHDKWCMRLWLHNSTFLSHFKTLRALTHTRTNIQIQFRIF